MCNKVIVEKGWLNRGKWICQKPEYKDGLCKKHYDAKIRASTPYGQREGYREPTLEEMKMGKTLYLKTRGSYGGHRMIKGVITVGDKHSITTIKPIPELFVIKEH